MKCSNCGQEYPDGNAFCPNCGTQNQTQQNGYQQNNYQQNTYQQGGYQQNNYQQGGFAPNGMGGYRVPIQQRSIGLCIFLSIITCGIYAIYWKICIVNELNLASGRVTDTSGGMVFLFSIITCGIYMYWWYYQAGAKVNAIRQRNGEMVESSSVLYLILSIFGLSIVNDCIIQGELNKVASLQ